MDFTFSEDQLLFQESARDFLVNEVTPEKIRHCWQSETGRDQVLWQQMADLGLTGVCVPEEFDGLGLGVLDFVLLAVECGYVALPEPLVNSTMVAAPTLQQLGGSLAATWLPKLASGAAKVVAGHELNLLVEDAHIADLLLLAKSDGVYALTPDQFSIVANESVDPSRRLFQVALKSGVTPVVTGDDARRCAQILLNHGALAAAAQALGLCQRMLDISVAYTSERQQFGQAIGSFQAVKHHLANIAVELEYAKAPLHRAAYALDRCLDNAFLAVSHAKLSACEAALLAAKNSIQVHGAMGYTWEVDLHIFMKKAWALAGSWGDAAYHKAQVAQYLFDEENAIGAGATLGE
ncbi:acyl-CoA dehydrogenase family protein [Halioxenophilus sp. WMMB6]|uniref:acyl-CoA dehydrogenase family protein n=1 Tax=Halioxenophilus sp. WMMB6 TaxID=3073815 RepID=UPI00295F5A43|nr:acyl-CoA dehydrogenase family protein [Halioxenophilus sp. WMMB6]